MLDIIILKIRRSKSVGGAVGREWGGNVCCGFVVNHTYKWWWGMGSNCSCRFVYMQRVSTCYTTRVPTQTGKPGKMEKLFPVREFCADWKSLGNLDKILENSGKFREFLFFVLFLIELYLLKWIKFSVFRPTWWVSSVVIQFGESWCSAACTCSPSTDSILGLLLTSYTIWVGWP